MYQNRLFLMIIIGTLLLLAACTAATQALEPAITPAPTSTSTREATDEPDVEGNAEPTIVSHGDENGGYVELVEALRAAGSIVDPAGEVEQPFFSVSGHVIAVDGGDVQLFEFANAEAAEVEAALISPNASTVGTSMVSWLATPHFYALDRIIALYVGDDAALLELLDTVLGQSIAEGQPFPMPPQDTAALLSDAFATSDYEAFEGLMGDTLTIGYWRSGGQVLSPAEGVEELRLNLLPHPAAVSFIRDRALFPDLDGMDPAAVFGPDVNVVDLVYSQGWGADGMGEAILTIAEKDDGGRSWQGIIYGSAGFAEVAGGPDVTALLSDVFVAADHEAFEGLMGDTFAIGYWRSGGQVLTAAEGVEELRLNLLPDPSAASFIRDQALFPDLDGMDPVGAFGPDENVVDLVYSQGWGADGLGEAILIIAEKADGGPFWQGIIYGSAGFTQLTGPPPDEQTLSGDETLSLDEALSFDPATYRNYENGFELDYPASWRLDERVLGPRGSGAIFYDVDDDPVFSAIVYLWDPKKNLDAWLELHRRSWSGSGASVLMEEELSLAGGRRAVQVELQWVGVRTNSLFMEVGERYLELFSRSDKETYTEIISTLRLVESDS